MTVLFRWLFFSALMRVGAIALAVVLLFLIAELISKIGYLGQGLNMSLLLEYLLLKTPLMVPQLMPIVVLIGVSVYVLELSHTHEMVALRAAGITFMSVLKPLLTAGLLVAFIMFAVGEWIEPLVNKRINYIDNVDINKKVEAQQGVQWLHEKNTFIRLTPLTTHYFAMLLLQRGEDGTWLKRIDTKKATYVDGLWKMNQANVMIPDAEQGFTTSTFETLAFPSSLSPKAVEKPDPKDMKWLELYHFEQVLKDAGLDSKVYLFELHKKLAAPLSCLIMVILAYSLCVNTGSRMGTKSKGVLLAISTGLLFYITSSSIEVLAMGERLPVVYAAWFPNVFFLGVAGYLLLKKEGY